MESAPNPFSHPYSPGLNRLTRTDPRKPLWQMSNLEKLSRAVEKGMLPRHVAEKELSSKDANVVFTGMRGLGSALLMGDTRWRPGMGNQPGATSLNPANTVPNLPGHSPNTLPARPV